MRVKNEVKRMAGFLRKLKWFYPGIQIKRWILLSVGGIGLLIFGSLRVVTETVLFLKVAYIISIFVGASCIIAGVRSMVYSFLSVFLPYFGEDLVDIIYKKRFLERGPRVVVIGGGHGLSTLLLGLKEYTTNLIAVVTVADSGGSSGRLREEFDILPPGDIRNCLVSLADAPSLMGELFQFRFKEDSELKGHNFGNLFITAMTQVTGDFKAAVEESSKVLAIRGKVLPSTLNKVSLVAEYEDGSQVVGEAQIPGKGVPIRKVRLQPAHDGKDSEIRSTPEAVDAINQAQVIVIGPGSLYTSLLPNLVIKEISDAVVNSSAVKIYVCNVMTQPGETDNYRASDHIKAIVAHTDPKIIDYCVMNTQMPPEDLLAKYRKQNSFPISVDIPKIKKMGYKVSAANILHAEDFVRHDPKKLARLIINTFRGEALRKEI